MSQTSAVAEGYDAGSSFNESDGTEYADALSEKSFLGKGLYLLGLAGGEIASVLSLGTIPMKRYNDARKVEFAEDSREAPAQGTLEEEVNSGVTETRTRRDSRSNNYDEETETEDSGKESEEYNSGERKDSEGIDASFYDGANGSRERSRDVVPEGYLSIVGASKRLKKGIGETRYLVGESEFDFKVIDEAYFIRKEDIESLVNENGGARTSQEQVVPKEYISIIDASKELGETVRSTKSLVDEAEFEIKTIGGAYFVRKEDINYLVNEDVEMKKEAREALVYEKTNDDKGGTGNENPVYKIRTEKGESYEILQDNNGKMTFVRLEETKEARGDLEKKVMSTDSKKRDSKKTQKEKGPSYELGRAALDDIEAKEANGESWKEQITRLRRVYGGSKPVRKESGNRERTQGNSDRPRDDRTPSEIAEDRWGAYNIKMNNIHQDGLNYVEKGVDRFGIPILLIEGEDKEYLPREGK